MFITVQAMCTSLSNVETFLSVAVIIKIYW